VRRRFPPKMKQPARMTTGQPRYSHYSAAQMAGPTMVDASTQTNDCCCCADQPSNWDEAEDALAPELDPYLQTLLDIERAGLSKYVDHGQVSVRKSRRAKDVRVPGQSFVG
jgi:hypothetical protein